MRKVCSAIFCLIMVVSALAAGEEDGGAERSVQDSISRMGYKAGFDRSRNTFVFIGRKLEEMKCPSVVKSFLMQREKCLKIAELKAKSALLRYLRQTRTGGEFVNVHEDNVKFKKDVGSVAGAFAENSLSGWYILVADESYDDGVYDCAVAVVWSPTLESAGRMAREGTALPSVGYRDELKAWLKTQDLTAWYGCRVFVDSAGFPHLLGIGVGDADGLSPLEMDALRMKCDLYARKNLLLGLWGDAEVRKMAADVISTTSDEAHEFDTESFFEHMASVQVEGKTTEGMLLVHDELVKNRLSGRKMLVVVYGVEPPSVVNRHGSGAGESKPMPKANGTASSGVKVFNPNTGRFEKVGVQ